MASILTSDQASKAMLEGLISCMRIALRERIMERIEPDIEEAIEAALKSFECSVATFRDPSTMRDTIKVLIERKSSDK